MDTSREIKTLRELQQYLTQGHKENLAKYHPRNYDSGSSKGGADRIIDPYLPLTCDGMEEAYNSRAGKSKTFIRRLLELLDFYAKVLKDYRIKQNRVPVDVRDEITRMVKVFVRMTINLPAKNVSHKYDSFTSPFKRKYVKTKDGDESEGRRGRPRTYEVGEALKVRGYVGESYALIVNRKLGANKTKRAKKK